jgi:hypothetical protein
MKICVVVGDIGRINHAHFFVKAILILPSGLGTFSLDGQVELIVSDP